MSKHRKTMTARATLSLIATVVAGTVGGHTATAAPVDDLTSLNLEQLMNIEITSVTKKAQNLADAPAAIYVITSDDIRRSSASSIPELLRNVPGLHVAQIDASNWAISSRGFNGRFSSKLLVLLDGRTLYTPLFSGVYWGVQDTLLDDIERIEVIRGPGGTLWGANAVNGVINIITKNAAVTHGGIANLTLGTQGSELSARYGESAGEHGNWRIYAKATDRDNFATRNDNDAHDAWDMLRAGFRFDTRVNDSQFTLQGDSYSGDNEQSVGVTTLAPVAGTSFVNDSVRNEGANLLARWTQKLADDSHWSVQAYIDHTYRRDLNLVADIDTFDIEFQHDFTINDTHTLTWGAGYRYIDSDLENSFTVAFTPEHRDQDLLNVFIQDEIRLNPALTLTLGTKYENNDFTGDEWQPSARLQYKLSDQQSVWAAVSRAVRTPSLAQTDLRLNVAAFSFPSLGVVSVLSNPDIKSEDLLSLELGYRGQLRNDLTLDVAAYYNDYTKLLTSEANAPFLETTPAPPHLVFSSTQDNNQDAHGYGIEISSTWQVTPRWRLLAGYSWQRLNATLVNGSSDSTRVTDIEDSVPEHILSLRSQQQLGEQVELDLSLYYVSELDAINIPAYTRADIRLGWKAYRNLNLDLVGQNLFDDRHPEFSAPDITGSEVPRSLLLRAKLNW